MSDSNSRLASLRERIKTRPARRRGRKSLPALPKRESPPKAGTGGNDVLAHLQSQLKDRAKRKEEAAKAPSVNAEDCETGIANTPSETEAEGAVQKSGVAKPVPAAVTPASGLGRQPAAKGFSSLVELGATIAAEFEKGQAETPVADFFSSLPKTPCDSWPHASIVPISSEARALILNWMTRLPERLFFLQTDLIELHFQKNGFSLRGDLEPGVTRSADMLDFARAAKKKELREKECLRMELPAPRGFQNTEIYCVSNPSVILERTEIVSRVVSQTNLLMLAGREEDPWDEMIEGAVSELEESFDAILPIVFRTKEGSCAWADYLASFDHLRVLPTLMIDVVTMKPDAKSVIPEGVRTNWSRRLQSGINLIDHRQEKREREIRKRQKDAERIQGQIELEKKQAQNASKGLLEELRHHLDEQVSGIQDSAKQCNKRQFSPTGEFTLFADEIAGQLTEAHLEKIASSASRRFGLPGVVVEAIEDEVMERLRIALGKTVEDVRGRLQIYSHNVEKRLTAFHQQPVSVDLPDLSEREIWNEVRQYCQIDPRIGIDLPKRDPLRMFMSGSRQFIMPISMILGGPLAKLLLPLFGADRSGLNSNPIFTGTLVGLMIVGLVLFFRNTKALDREKMEQSVEKMRDTVRSKILREMERVEKEKMELVLTTVARVKDECQGNLKTWVDEAISASQQRLSRESAKVKSASVILQKRVREVDQTRKDVEKLKEGFLSSTDF